MITKGYTKDGEVEVEISTSKEKFKTAKEKALTIAERLSAIEKYIEGGYFDS